MTANGPATGPSDERFEEAVQSLLAERGRTTNGDIRAVLDGIDELPARSGDRRRSWLAAAAAIAILVIGGGFALGRIPVPSFGQPGTGPGPAAFEGDPRLADCEAQIGSPAAQVFEMAHASWFPLYFPGWSRGAPELEVQDPALVVIGPQLPGMNRVPRIEGDPTPATTPSPMFRMCIAVGTPNDATLHDYGYTWFDRIVPMLSAEDLAKATHLDPDVLAAPSAWPFPDRLAPCGGITGNELYVFEMVHLSDFPRHFPGSGLDPFAGDDEPAVVVVYRDPLPISRLAEASPNPNDHDVCVAAEVENAQPDHEVLPGVDITGFHVRIDAEQALPSIVPTIEPSQPAVTPEPLPAWAGDAAANLACDGPPSDIGPSGPQDFERLLYDSGQTVANYLDFVKAAGIPFPADGFAERDRATGVRLYAYDVGGATKAVIVTRTEDGTEAGRWMITSVASCDPSEYDPGTPVGGDIHIWTDADGNRVSTADVLERADCYNATRLTVDGRLYLRDPGGQAVDRAQLEGTYDASATLPKSASLLPYRDGRARMYVASDGRALYIVDGKAVERLPHVKGDEIQRIDCN